MHTRLYYSRQKYPKQSTVEKKEKNTLSHTQKDNHKIKKLFKNFIVERQVPKTTQVVSGESVFFWCDTFFFPRRHRRRRWCLHKSKHLIKYKQRCKFFSYFSFFFAFHSFNNNNNNMTKIHFTCVCVFVCVSLSRSCIRLWRHEKSF